MRIVLGAAIFLAALTVALPQERSPKVDKNRDAEQELTRIEREFGETLTRRDAAALDRLMADDFLAINPLGRELTKAQVLAEFASPDYEIESLRNEDIRVRVFGDAAVATARGVVKGRYKGQDASGQFRYTRVWIRRGGRWQAVAAQSTMLPPQS